MHWQIDTESILKDHERDANFDLREDEDFLYILKNGETIATLSSSGATEEAIHEVIQKEMDRL